jgi:predicted N-acyltransferase
MRSTIDVVRSIEQVDQDEWDALCGARPFADHRWLRLTEAVLLDYSPRYILLRQEGRLVAGAICSLRRRFENGSLQRRAGWLVRRHPCLRCLVPIALDPGLVLRSDCDQHGIVAGMLAAMGDLAAREHASFSRVDYLPSDDPAWHSLDTRGYMRLRMCAETSLEIRWPAFQDYLAWLPSRKRKHIARMQRRALQEGIVVERLQPSAATAPRLAHLIDNVLDRYHEHERYIPELFTTAATILGDDLILLVARQEGRITGCATLLRSGDEIAAKWLGLDYSRTRDTGTYHRLLVECVAQALALGARRLRTGATAYETKQHFGVVQAERYGALAMTNRALNRAAGMALRLAESRMQLRTMMCDQPRVQVL